MYSQVRKHSGYWGCGSSNPIGKKGTIPLHNRVELLSIRASVAYERVKPTQKVMLELQTIYSYTFMNEQQ
jgi:hypothetical protein